MIALGLPCLIALPLNSQVRVKAGCASPVASHGSEPSTTTGAGEHVGQETLWIGLGFEFDAAALPSWRDGNHTVQTARETRKNGAILVGGVGREGRAPKGEGWLCRGTDQSGPCTGSYDVSVEFDLSFEAFPGRPGRRVCALQWGNRLSQNAHSRRFAGQDGVASKA